MDLSVTQIITETLSGSSIYAAVLATVLFIGIGYIATRSGLFNKQINGKLGGFVFTWILPFIGIISFMQAPDKHVANILGIVLGLSISFYIIGVIVSWLIVKYAPKLISQKVIDKSYQLWEQQNPDALDKTLEKHREYYIDEFRKKLIVGQQLTIYSSITFFAIPLVRALPDVFGTSGIGLLWIWHIVFSILVNSHSRIVISGQKIQKSELGVIIKNVMNPTLILTLVSLGLWALQFINTEQKLGEWFIPTGTSEGSTFWNFSVTLPLVFRPLSIGVGLLSPFIWLVIGGSLATSNFKTGIKDKGVWGFSLLKLIAIPLSLFLIMIGFVRGGIINSQVATLIVIMQAAPPATIITVYTVKWSVRQDYSSQITSLSTVIGLITIPIWLILSRIVFQVISPESAGV